MKLRTTDHPPSSSMSEEKGRSNRVQVLDGTKMYVIFWTGDCCAAVPRRVTVNLAESNEAGNRRLDSATDIAGVRDGRPVLRHYQNEFRSRSRRPSRPVRLTKGDSNMHLSFFVSS